MATLGELKAIWAAYDPVWVILGAYAIAQAADIYTTKRALKSTGAREGNPVVAWLMRVLGNNWPYAKVAVSAAAAYVMYAYGGGYGLVGVGVIALLTFAVAISNYKLAKKLEANK